MHDIYTKEGQPLPHIDKHPIQFISTAENAEGRFFEMGYILTSEEGLFVDDKRRCMFETFPTTSGGNSTEDEVPDRLSILMKESPYRGIPIKDLRFGVLHVHRYIQPNMRALRGGKRRSSRRNSHRTMTKSRRRS